MLIPNSAHADVIRAHNDAYATGWYPDEPDLPAEVGANGSFGQLFNTPADGQVYAHPLVRNGHLLIETEHNTAYAFDPETGAQQWVKHFGAAWDPTAVSCADISPEVGITGTPAIDPATNIEYFTSKVVDPNGPPGAALYKMHALNIDTGDEQPGFPVTLGGVADNAPGTAFNAKYELQRPGLLLQDGVVYAGFGGHCDRTPYQGWIFGVSTSGQIKARWSAQAAGGDGSGIWQSGGALISDGASGFFVASGNGDTQVKNPTPGHTPPGNLSEAVAHITVQSNGQLLATDFFTPYDADLLDDIDADFGSGGPVALPESYNGTPLFGTADHPHLMLEEGKAGYIYLLDRDDLGGFREGDNGEDGSLMRLGGLGGVWSTPAVWPGDGGYVYIVHGSMGPPGFNGGYMRAYKYGLDGNGKPTLSIAGETSDGFGFGAGAPIVTSDALTPGSALVWSVWRSDRGGGQGSELRAYDAVPVNGVMQLRWSAPIGKGVKFAPPVADNGRIYVATSEGVFGFGPGAPLALRATPSAVRFPDTMVNQFSSTTLTVQANQPLTISSITRFDPVDSLRFGIGTPSPALGTALNTGDTMTIPVTFRPTSAFVVSGTLTLNLSDGTKFVVSATGRGVSQTSELYVQNTRVSLGGTAVNGPPISLPITISNTGGAPLKFTNIVPPAAPISVSGLPAVGSTLAAGASITATLMFKPTTAGVFAELLTLYSDSPAPATNKVTIFISGSAAPDAHLVVSPPTTYFGAVRTGRTVMRTVTLRNAGGTTMTINKSKPPGAGEGFVANSDLPEGSQLKPGESVTLSVSFTATDTAHHTDTWVVNGSDDSGLHNIGFDAYGSPPTNAYWMVDTTGHVYSFGNGQTFTSNVVVGANAVALAPLLNGQGAYVLDDTGQVQAVGGARLWGHVPVGGLRPGERATTMSVTPSGNGYWVFTSQGRVFNYGLDAQWFGDMALWPLNAPVVSSVATPSGQGYYMVGADGGVFGFGDAHFYGTMALWPLNSPIVGMVPTPSGNGYWMAGADGGIFGFGDARFLGSMGAFPLNKPVVGIVRYGNGYIMVGSDGGIFDFSDTAFVGSLGDKVIPKPIVGVGAFAA